jgi:predicted alpha/beta hydrolase
MHTIEKITVLANDDVPLRGQLVLAENPVGVIQFNGGTAAKKEYYLPFLEYLADHGFIGCLWDYRGSGESAPENLGRCDYTFSDYGIKDMPAIKNYLKTRFPTLPLILIGHSGGGQQAGLSTDINDYAGMIGFAVSAGYLPNMPLRYRILGYYFFNIFSPLSILIAGCVRAKRFGYMEDLPKNVLLEWRDWCRKPDYLFDPDFSGNTIPKGSYHDMPFPIHVFSATDDTISRGKNVERFWKHVHSKSGIKHVLLKPEEMRFTEIGHFGFFHKKMVEKFWPTVLEVAKGFLVTPTS